MNDGLETVHAGERTGNVRLWTVPNWLSAARLIGSPAAAWLAYLGRESWFIALLVFLLITDWIDGKLAKWLHQRTDFGAKLDTLADVALYAAIALSLVLLRPEILRSTWPWIAAAAVSYVVSVLASVAKFRRMPSYHTRAAKTGWALTSAGTLAVLIFSWRWPFTVVGAWASVTNFEAVAITMTLDRWRADVPTIWHAVTGRHADTRSTGQIDG